MAAPDVDLVLLGRLIHGAPWREFLEQVLLPEYLRVAQTLDKAKEDHRYWQGVKEGLRWTIEKSYELTHQGSPLVLPGKAPRPRSRPTREATETEGRPVLPLRQSYLA